MNFELFVTPGLGDNSYLIESQGEALLVDPQRDAWRFLEAVQQRKLSLKYTLETHVHNDYLSGALAIHEATGAVVAAPACGNYEFPHRGLREGDTIRLGDLRLVCLETPGHTPEHVAYLVFDGGSQSPLAILTGGSLMVGSAGRTDLFGEAQTRKLTADQFRSLRRLASYGDDPLILPTHGAGSFCAATGSSLKRTSTLDAERDSNPALREPDEAGFARRQLANLPAFPTYYRSMAPINRIGPAALACPPRPAALSAAEVEQLARSGAWIVDARDRLEFAAAHIPGSINIEIDHTFASYVGWTVPFGRRVVLLLPDASAWEEPVTQLLRIGYDEVAGMLAGGINSWISAGMAVSSYPVASIDDLCRSCLEGQAMTILDVRQRAEWERGHIPEKSRHLFVGDLPAHLDDLPGQNDFWTICASGHRAAIAASLLDRAGRRVRLVARGGVPEWAAHCYPQAAG